LDQYVLLSSGVVAGEDQGKAIVPHKFWAVGKVSENLFLVGKFSSKNAKFEAETHFGEI